MRLIDKDKLKTAICIACSNGVIEIEGCASDDCTLQSLIDDQPTIEAEPVRHGRWIQYSRNADETYIECSNCCVASRPRHLQMVTRTGSGLPDYCPNCGARMDLRTQTEAALDMADSVMMGGADNG
jgi:hypothetical protein